ncbi:hypothetical protein M2323_002675 [Rhodoblastus acidophilus]|uniref:hypothetical protein n=1 Tax=Rhodoblastus acidophilus TaxID=1074 RepID=UPI0022243914|nr:hypothetical protein [Rhodoblastus acidophilus]MCW2284788.1 hypothetical protein [Rhodoblastus acidophilus]MCW2333741.1 hypothetical protein [Rhodoblastus acidophilus]
METKAQDTDARICVTLAEPDLTALDAWRERQPDTPERVEALRRLAVRALRELGSSDTIALEDLNASNDE